MCTGAFSIWGGGFLFQRGVIDYSGGYVIHVSSGTAGFVAAWWVGPRIKQDRDLMKPHNILLSLVGCGILWIGWNGFNGGDPYAASPDAGAAVLNTNLATAVSLLIWMTLDVIFFKKPAVIGAIQGMITGLVAITPAAGELPILLLPRRTDANDVNRCRCWLGGNHHWCFQRFYPMVHNEYSRTTSCFLPRCRRHT